MFATMFSNHILNLCFLSWLLAQTGKFVLTIVFKGKVRVERLYGAGGMPSAHTATVCALMMGTARKCGYNSADFAISAILASIVIYDAMGVRRAAGKHASAINKIMQVDEVADVVLACDETAQDIDGDGHKEHKMLNESLGHTPVEVVCGAMLGIIISMIYNYFVYLS